MKIKNIFEEENVNQYIARLEKLENAQKPNWGKMNAAQMLAHLNVSYTQAKNTSAANYSWLTKLMLKAFVKNIVVGEKPYKKNSRTAPAFLISDEKDFLKEKEALISNMKEVLNQGPSFYEGKESAGFGKLTAKQWNNMFAKHIEHHFEQFSI